MPTIPDLVIATATQNGVDPNLALAVAQTESNFNPNAVSPAGAIGVMQLEPPTAAQYGVSNPYDPPQNIRGGVQYLRDLLAQFGDTAQALAAYDWGPARVASAVSSYGADWLAHAPAETQNYVGKILARLGTGYASPASSVPPGVLEPLHSTGNVVLLTAIGIGVFLLAQDLFD